MVVEMEREALMGGVQLEDLLAGMNIKNLYVSHSPRRKQLARIAEFHTLYVFTVMHFS
jgi:hypothetical protein